MAERVMQVTIIRDKRSLGDYKPGEVGKPFSLEDTWYIACPECGNRASLSNHQAIENEDGTLTLSPSLLCPGNNYEPKRCSAHYFIERNQIRWC